LGPRRTLGSSALELVGGAGVADDLEAGGQLEVRGDVADGGAEGADQLRAEALVGLGLAADEHRGAATGVSGGVDHVAAIDAGLADADAGEIDLLLGGVAADDGEVGVVRGRAAVADQQHAVPRERVVSGHGELVRGHQAAVELGAAAELEGVELLEHDRISRAADRVHLEHGRVLRVPGDDREGVALAQVGRQRLAGRVQHVVRLAGHRVRVVERERQAQRRAVGVRERLGADTDLQQELGIAASVWSCARASLRRDRDGARAGPRGNRRRSS
jgi:hypothetical protein